VGLSGGGDVAHVVSMWHKCGLQNVGARARSGRWSVGACLTTRGRSGTRSLAEARWDHDREVPNDDF
jgi:hypothetical protein